MTSETFCNGSAAPEPPPVPLDPVTPKAWGFWATLGFSLICAAVWFVVQVAVGIAFAIGTLASNPDIDVRQVGAELEGSGLFLSAAEVVATPICLALLCLFVRIRRRSIAEYLGFGPLRLKQTLVSLGLLAVLLAASDLVTIAAGREVVPKFMVDIYTTAGWLGLLLLTLILVAPLIEETFFRGFLFRGIAESRAGPTTAIILTSLAWAAIHVQYDWFGMCHVFVLGLFLGIIRLKTGSTTLTILLHAATNLAASVQVIVKVEFPA